MEPWYQVVKAVAVPPTRFWFALRFEDLEQLPEEGPAIVASNHISYLDPFTAAAAITRRGRKPRFMGKEEIFDIPLVGRALKGAGQIAVRRGSGDQTPLVEAEEALAAGELVVIYPEGTVTTRPDWLPMDGKTGVVRLSLSSGVPIVPMASWGSQPVWQKSGKGSIKFGRPVWVKIGAPIDLSERSEDANDHDALKAMTAEVMDAVTDLAQDLRAHYPKRWEVPSSGSLDQ